MTNLLSAAGPLGPAVFFFEVLMSMRDASHSRTVCEVLREINDLHQGDTQIDISTRALLREAVDMAKRMDRKLKEYNQQWDSQWWDDNPDADADMERRMAIDYLAMDDDVIPEAVRRIPSMGGREIGRYLREWAADVPSGCAIVELGSWLGAGTAQLALGSKGSTIHAFDRFTANKSECEKARVYNIILENGESTLDVVRGLIGKDLTKRIEFHQGLITKAQWNGQKIGLYVDDACKRKKEFLSALNIFGRSFIPGKTVIVLMDYWYFERFPEDLGLKYQLTFMTAHKDSFRWTHGRLPGTSASAFLYLGGKPWEDVR
jgi:hypothetical protein